MSLYLADDDETARDCRVDVTARNVTYPLNRARHHQTKGQTDGNNIFSYHSTAAEEIKQQGAEKFCQKTTRKTGLLIGKLVSAKGVF